MQMLYRKGRGVGVGGGGSTCFGHPGKEISISGLLFKGNK